MKIMMIWDYYDDFLKGLYRSDPELKTLSYDCQREFLLKSHFGWPAELALQMMSIGIEVDFIISNAKSLQEKWRKEFGAGSLRPGATARPEAAAEEIVAAQIRRFRPDILWMPLQPRLAGAFLDEMREYYGCAVLWIGCAVPPGIEFRRFAAVLSPLPSLCTDLDPTYRAAFRVNVGFDPGILDELGPVEKTRSLTFVGGVSPAHMRRAEYLAELADAGVEFEHFGYLREGGDDNRFRALLEKIRPRHRGVVYGIEMHRILASSRVTLNIHVDIAGNMAANMRLFEATGAGACLLTEKSDNIRDFFEPCREVAVYDSKENFIESVRSLLADHARTTGIARRGQERTLRDHTVARMCERIIPIFERCLAARSEQNGE